MRMSDAPVSTARATSWFTRRITGASLARSFSRSVSSSLGASPSGPAGWASVSG